MAGEQVGSIYVDLDLKADKFHKELQDAEGKANSFGDKLKGGLASIGEGSQKMALGMAAGGVAIGLFAKQSFDAFSEADAAAVKLQQNLLTVKGNTMEHVNALQLQAAELQKVGVIEADTIVAGQSQLATFGLQASTIQKVTPKIQDMIAQLKGYNATAEDEVAINNLAGKVLTGNVGALSKYGVTLSETQKKVMQNGNETERASMLTEVLSQNYGKVNEALGKTPKGQLTQLTNTLGDVQEALGGVIAAGIQPFLGGITEWISKFTDLDTMNSLVENGMKKIGEYAPVIATVIGGVLVAAVTSLTIALLANPMTWFVLALVALGFVIKAVIDHFGGLGNVLKALEPTFRVIKTVFDLIWGALMGVWDAIAKELLPSLQQLWNAISPVLMPVLKVLGAVLGVVIVGAIMAVLVVIRVIIGAISLWVNYITWVVNVWKDAWNWFMKVTGLGDMFKAAGQAIINGLKGAFDWVADKAKGVRDALSNLNPFQRHSPSLIDNIQAGAKVIRYEYGNLFKDVDRMSLSPAQAFNNTTNNNQQSVQTSIYGNIQIGSDADADSFLTRLSRNQELAKMGVATR